MTSSESVDNTEKHDLISHVDILFLQIERYTRARFKHSWQWLGDYMLDVDTFACKRLDHHRSKLESLVTVVDDGQFYCHQFAKHVSPTLHMHKLADRGVVIFQISRLVGNCAGYN